MLYSVKRAVIYSRLELFMQFEYYRAESFHKTPVTTSPKLRLVESGQVIPEDKAQGFVLQTLRFN